MTVCMSCCYRNVQVLEEKLRTAEARYDQAREQLSDYAQLQAQVAQLQREATHWKTVLTVMQNK